MANRHLSRSVVLQTLFEWDFKQHPDNAVGEILERDTEEFAPGLDDQTFMETILDNVVKKKTIIDQIIEKAAPEWPIDKINAVDRNILRMGLSELLFGDRAQVPPKVAINEAIELGKTFGGENSGRFINGVLGAVYRELGEPGKDDKGRREKRNQEPIDIDKLPVERKVGAVVYTEHEGEFYLALVHDVFGYWTLSKGGIEDNIEEKAGCIREIKEEMNVDIDKVEEIIGESDYVASHPEKGKIRKKVIYFLAHAPWQDVTLMKQGGLDDAKWFKLGDIPELKIYDDITGFIAKAIGIITSRK